MIRKLVFLTALLFLMSGSASAWEYVNTYHDYITSSHTIAAGDSTASLLVDTSNYQWYNITGGLIKIRYRFKTDTVLTAGLDSFHIWIDCTPNKGDADSANLYTNLYVNSDASPSTSWEYSNFQVEAADSANFWENWKVYFTNADSVTQAQETALLGNTYEDTLEIFIEVWE